MWRTWDTPHSFLLVFIGELWKPEKSEFWKNENCWRYHHPTPVHQKPQSYEVQFLRYKVWKNENFKRIKKPPRDTIILQNCTKDKVHKLYCSWDMACDRYNCYFSFWAISLPFYPPKSPKIKLLKKWKNTWRYHHFTLVYQKLWLDDLWLLRCDVRHTNGQTDGQKKLDREVGRANATKERR